MLHLLGVPQRQLECRGGAGGDTHDIDLVNVECVEQIRERIGLVGGCRVGWNTRTSAGPLAASYESLHVFALPSRSHAVGARARRSR